MTLSDLRSTSWEDGEGKSYRFKIDSRMNDTDSSPVDGVAERTGDHVTVKLKQPEAKTFTLDGSTVFPTQQIQRIIEAARAGKSVLELTVYDGSDNGEKVYNTLSVIGQAIPGDKAIATPDPSTTSDVDEIADALAGHGQLLRPRRQSPRKANRRRSIRCRSSFTRTASRGRWCSTTTISSLPARWANSTSRIPSRVSEGSRFRVWSFGPSRNDCFGSAIPHLLPAFPVPHRQCPGSPPRCRISCADRPSRARHGRSGGRACRCRRPRSPGAAR